MLTFRLNLKDLGHLTRRRFCSDVFDDYRKILVDSIPNYKISKDKPGEQRPKFLSVSNGREFYYIIEDIKIKDISLKNTAKIEENQRKETFDTSKSKQILDISQIKRLDNIKNQESIFKTKIDNINNIDITDKLKKITLFFSGRDTLFINMPKDPNEIGAKFILKGYKPIKQGDFVKV